MRYIVSTYTEDEEEISIIVSCRATAKTETLFRKCAAFMDSALHKRNLINNGTEWYWDLPNIWRNGAVGALWCDDPFYNVTIRREDCEAYIAM